jgi:membrane protein CcdC involved in cytochrome C biogenesis
VFHAIAFPAISGPTAAIASVIGAIAVLAWRISETRSAVSVKKIVFPPLGMATGSCMFVVPAFRVPVAWAAIAFVMGAVALAYPLLRTSRLIRDGDRIMMQRSGAFLAVILALAAIRYAARSYLDTLLTVEQTAALFYLLAFGMIVRWRVGMLLEYRKLTAALAPEAL